MSPARVFTLTLLAMLAFAANSVLCRMALKHTAIDAASFTAVRIGSGALALALIAAARGGPRVPAGNWGSALALFAYAALFSFAYLDLPTATGALLLFGAVQATMIIAGLVAGERLSPRQGLGLALALGGVVALLLPGVAAPPLLGALLMIVAGVAWGFYSLRGRGGGDPTRTTAGNFLRAVPMALALSAATLPWARLDPAGAGYALLSGALASGVGYAIWYSALPGLRATSAATVQLSVPVIAALGGVVLVAEPLSLRLVFCSAAVLGGIAMVVLNRRPAR